MFAVKIPDHSRLLLNAFEGDLLPSALHGEGDLVPLILYRFLVKLCRLPLLQGNKMFFIVSTLCSWASASEGSGMLPY